MSERNGDKARFQKNRKRKLLHRRRLQALMAGVLTRTAGGASAVADRSRVAAVTDAASRTASLAMQDEGGPTRAGD